MRNWRGVCTVVGGLVIYVSQANFYTVANMNTYIISYLRARRAADLTYADALWLGTTQLFARCFTIWLGAWLQPRLGTPWTAFLGCVLFSLFTALTYFAIDVSFLLVVATFSFLPALGTGITSTIVSINSAKVRLSEINFWLNMHF